MFYKEITVWCLHYTNRLRDSGAAKSPESAQSNVTSSGTSTKSGEPRFKSIVKSVLLVMNLGSSIFMAATGALGVGSANSINDTGTIFVGIYMILFAAVLFTFEVAQFCAGSSIDNIMKRNFGFLYGYIGKGLFILL